jgi:hypothetical protein
MATTARDRLEIVTAILLGLVSVATAFGAYQAAAWTQQAADFSSVSQQLRDRNLTEALTSQLISRDDTAKLLKAIALSAESTLYPERLEAVAAEQEILISSASPELATAWRAWVASDFDDDLVPITAPDYQAALFAVPQSLQYASYEADRLADAVIARATQLTVAAVVFAISLFLLGVAGVTQTTRVAAWLTGGAAFALLAGLAITALAGA